YCIDPAMEAFHGRIVSQNQIYVLCAIEPILDLPNGFLVRATLPKRQPRTYALSRYLNGAGDAQGSDETCSSRCTTVMLLSAILPASLLSGGMGERYVPLRLCSSVEICALYAHETISHRLDLFARSNNFFENLHYW